ncbi:MAG: hypothetical protein LUD01_02980 [Clostridiales bacterium]|nr:hypothetical protein [Clostridiales bacterium]
MKQRRNKLMTMLLLGSCMTAALLSAGCDGGTTQKETHQEEETSAAAETEAEETGEEAENTESQETETENQETVSENQEAEGAGDTAATASEWATLYADYLESSDAKTGTYYTIYLNNDDISEIIYAIGDSGDTNGSMLYIEDGEVKELELGNKYSDFIEKSGYLWDNSVSDNQESFFLYSLDDAGSLQILHEGIYAWDHDQGTSSYTWDGTEVTTEEYSTNQANVAPATILADMPDGTVSSMIGQTESYVLFTEVPESTLSFEGTAALVEYLQTC